MPPAARPHSHIPCAELHVRARAALGSSASVGARGLHRLAAPHGVLAASTARHERLPEHIGVLLRRLRVLLLERPAALRWKRRTRRSHRFRHWRRRRGGGLVLHIARAIESSDGAPAQTDGHTVPEHVARDQRDEAGGRLRQPRPHVQHGPGLADRGPPPLVCSCLRVHTIRKILVVFIKIM